MKRAASSSEVAAALGLSAATVQRYAREGRIRHSTTPGGHRRFDVDEVRSDLGMASITSVSSQSATAVVLTALDTEFRAVRALLDGVQVRRMPSGTRYHMGSVQGRNLNWIVAVAEIGEGNVSAAIETAKAIEWFEPEIVLFVGVAGSLKSDVVHGDVVVANRVYNFQSGKADIDFYSRAMTFPTWHGLEQLVRTVRLEAWTDVDPTPAVSVKPIAAGEVVVSSKDSVTFRLLRDRCNDAVAVDMESAGVYEAAHRSGGVAVLAVRGISDMLDDKTAAGDANWQPIASSHAASFAIALLKAADPGDLGLSPKPDSYSTEGTDLLASVPPPAAEILRSIVDGSPVGSRLLRTMADPARTPAQRAEAMSRILEETTDARLWIAFGEFVAAHRLYDIASRAFEDAGDLEDSNPARWYARAAMNAAAHGNQERTTRMLEMARAARPAGRDATYVDVMAAAVAEDADALLETTAIYGHGDGLVDLLRVRALHVQGHIDEALDLARRALRDHPNQALTGGLALETARLLLATVEEPGRRINVVEDVEQAKKLALEVRDLRRSWSGPSEDAVTVAAAAAAMTGDFDTVMRLALRPPDGEATEQEAGNQELIVDAANAALARHAINRAQQLAAMIEDPVERTLVEAECLVAQGNGGREAIAILEAVPKDLLTPAQMFRVLMDLASAGVWPIEGIERLEEEDAEGAELVRATADIVAGDLEAGARRLRRLRTLRAISLLVGAYVEAERIDDAVALLRNEADRFSRPQFRLRAAGLLASAGRLEAAYEEAMTVIVTVPDESYIHLELRHLCLDLASRLRNWEAMVSHARAALNEGTPHGSSVVWALVGGLFNLRELDAARRELVTAHPTAHEEDEARLAIELLRTGPATEEATRWVLDLGDQFSESEIVSAAAFTAALQMSRELELPEETGGRIRQLSDSFFDRWPTSDIITRIDVTDPTVLIEYLKENLAPDSEATAGLIEDVLMGRLPYGMLTAIRGRFLGEALVTGKLGCLPIGTPDPNVAAQERHKAGTSLGSAVVIDAHALYVSGNIGLDAATLMSSFSRVLVPRSTLDDLIGTADSLRLESTRTMAWDPRRDKPVLIEVDESQAVSWHAEAIRLLDRVRSCHIRDELPLVADDPNPDVLLGSLELARRERLPLWSDDPSIRQIARNEGMDAFGTVSLIEALVDAGDLTEDELERSLLAMIRSRFVDTAFRPDLILRVAEEDEWNARSAAFTLTRPSAWINPVPALGVYRRSIMKAATEAPNSLTDWAYVAAIGAGRATAPHLRRGAIATLVLSGFLHTGSQPDSLALLLKGARLASSDVGLDDPLIAVVQLLRDALEDSVDAALIPGVFTQMTSGLAERDRRLALGELLNPTSRGPLQGGGERGNTDH